MSKDAKNVIKYCIVIIAILLFFKICAEDNSTSSFYEEHKSAIDDYNYRHKDDWNGYKGTRRNSWAETNKLKQDGIDPDEYREEHGY